MSLTLTSPVFKHEHSIPRKYTCEGENISPPLQWDGIPSNTKSLVLIVDDPDAPDPENPKHVWVHWIVYNISPILNHFEDGSKKIPKLTQQGLNDWNQLGYGGPCPPIGRHRYYFKLFAIDTHLDNLIAPTKYEILKQVEGHTIETSILIGTYEKNENKKKGVMK